MSRVLVPADPGLIGDPTRATVNPSLDTRTVQSATRVSFIAAIRDNDKRRLDTVAGSEFLDDRIRLQDDLSPWS
jgi:hypothetical protein